MVQGYIVKLTMHPLRHLPNTLVRCALPGTFLCSTLSGSRPAPAVGPVLTSCGFAHRDGGDSVLSIYFHRNFHSGRGGEFRLQARVSGQVTIQHLHAVLALAGKNECKATLVETEYCESTHKQVMLSEVHGRKRVS